MPYIVKNEDKLEFSRLSEAIKVIIFEYGDSMRFENTWEIFGS